MLAYALSSAWVIPWAATGHVVLQGKGWPTHFPSLVGPMLAAFAVTAWTAGRTGVREGRRTRMPAEARAVETVMGYDLVCSAPKSVSLLWAVGDDRIRADIAEAFDSAVDATLGYLEQHGCFGMVDGRNRPGEGFGLASFVHDTSRANEAHFTPTT